MFNEIRDFITQRYGICSHKYNPEAPFVQLLLKVVVGISMKLGPLICPHGHCLLIKMRMWTSIHF